MSGYIGNVAYIEMSAYYTENLDILWTGYLTPSAYGYQGILMDLNFNLYNQSNN